MTEDQRRAIVESGLVWLSDGLRAGFAGIMIPEYCSIHSSRPGEWACSWETAAEVCVRPDRRFLSTDTIWRMGNRWLGFTPRRDDYQTEEDWQRAQEKATRAQR